MTEAQTVGRGKTATTTLHPHGVLETTMAAATTVTGGEMIGTMTATATEDCTEIVMNLEIGETGTGVGGGTTSIADVAARDDLCHPGGSDAETMTGIAIGGGRGNGLSRRIAERSGGDWTELSAVCLFLQMTPRYSVVQVLLTRPAQSGSPRSW